MAPDQTTDTVAFTAHDLTLKLVVKARRETVWRLWTESEHLARWWGPHGFTNPECSIDPEPGGAIRILMRSPEGEQFLNVSTVRVVQAPARLVFTIALVNSDGSHRLEIRTTVDLADLGDQTEVTIAVRVLHATPEADENLAGMHDGWSQSLDDLAHLAQRDGRS